jgi:protein SCO1/2
MILTPEGRLARYLYGIKYSPRDVRLGLVEAAQHRIGSPVDQILLTCYHYDPVVGKYNLAIMSVIRIAGLITVMAVGATLLVMLRRERRGNV